MNQQNQTQGSKRLWGRSVRFSDGGNNARPDTNTRRSPSPSGNHHHGLPLRVFVGSVALRHNQSNDRHWRRRSGALHCGGLCLRSSLCAEADVIGPEMTKKRLSQISSALSQAVIALLITLLAASSVHSQHVLVPL